MLFRNLFGPLSEYIRNCSVNILELSSFFGQLVWNLLKPLKDFWFLKVVFRRSFLYSSGTSETTISHKQTLSRHRRQINKSCYFMYTSFKRLYTYTGVGNNFASKFWSIFWTKFSRISGIMCISGGYQDLLPGFCQVFTFNS